MCGTFANEAPPEAAVSIEKVGCAIIDCCPATEALTLMPAK
jgi:hypothetical protein